MPQGSASSPSRVSQSSYRPEARPWTCSSMGQLPASSFSKRSSWAVARAGHRDSPFGPVVARTHEVADTEERRRNDGRGGHRREAVPAWERDDLGCGRLRCVRERRWSSGGGPTSSSSSCSLSAARARPARDRHRRCPARHHRRPLQLVAELGGEMAQRGTCSRLDGAERHAQEAGDLALRHAAPVRELDQRSLLLGEASSAR